MAFTRALFTSLSVWGGPGPASAALAETDSVSDTLSVSVTDSTALAIFAALTGSDTLSVTLTESASLSLTDVHIDRTQLGVTGGPAPFTEIGDKTIVTTFELTVSDSLSVQWLEEPVDENYITTADTVRVTLSETASLRNNIEAFDTLSISVSESIALLQSGVTLKTASDTLSVTVTEAVTISVTVEVTDTASVTFSAETATVATPIEVIAASDTLSVSVDDASLLQVFTGTNPLSSSDNLNIALVESAIVLRRTPVDPYRIRIIPRPAQIRIVPL